MWYSHRGVGSSPTTSAAGPQAEEAIRVSDWTAPAANLQHGASVAHDGQLAQHDGDRRCDEDGQQGAQEAVRQTRCGTLHQLWILPSILIGL